MYYNGQGWSNDMQWRHNQLRLFYSDGCHVTGPVRKVEYGLIHNPYKESALR